MACAAAEFDDPGIYAHLGRDIFGIFLENSDFSARRVVFRKPADLFEKSRAALIVKEFTRDRFPRTGEAIQDGIPETLLTGRQIMKGKARFIPHQLSSASRNPAKAQRAEGGKKLR